MKTYAYLHKNLPVNKIIDYKPNVSKNELTIGHLRTLNEIIERYCALARRSNFNIGLPNPVNLWRNEPSANWNKNKADDSNKTWGVRYRDYVKDISGGLTIPANLTSTLSERAKRLASGAEDQTVYFDFHDGIDWEPGEYHESKSSCLWREYNSGRQYANEEGLVGAMRFYNKDGDPVGRMLLYFEDGVIVVFNMYHCEGMPLETASSILASYLSEKLMTKHEMSSCHLRCTGLYINSGAIAVYPADLGYNDTYTMPIPDINRCYECDDCYLDGDGMYVRDGSWVCFGCLEDYYVQCDNCGEYIRHNSREHRVADEQHFCRGCYNSLFYTCERCGEGVRKNESNLINRSIFCGTCYLILIGEAEEA